ncbi:hypothetical protein EV401DRAFT_2077587 [Pisolithus croceorrhizus]|nr:hypothetical protein EV401DRAFT_2077587 [Pisolithus croceorrhizus]
MMHVPLLKRHMQSQINNAIGDRFSLPSQDTTTQSIAEHGVRCLLIFEYCYFLLQKEKSPAEQDVIPLAIKEYKDFNVAATVCKAVETAVQQHDQNVDELCQALLQVVLENRMSCRFLP